MGRQAYLAKIAFGRSAFEPSSQDIQDESSRSEQPPPVDQDVMRNDCVQLYDERGYPINPGSHEYGKKLRDAQNDVLASVGVVERRRTSSESLLGSYGEHVELLEAEDSTSQVIATTSVITKSACTWPIGTIRERLLTFHCSSCAPFSHIVAAERARSGTKLLYVGWISRSLSIWSMQTMVYRVFEYQPFDRLLYALGAGSRASSFSRNLRRAFKPFLPMTMDIMFYPFFYHGTLQRLGLIPVRPLLPSVGFVKSNWTFYGMLHLSSTHHAPPTIVGYIAAVLASPLALICVEQAIDRWLRYYVTEFVEARLVVDEHTAVHQQTTMHSDPRWRLLILARNVANRFITAYNRIIRLNSCASEQDSCATSESCSTNDLVLDVNGTEVTNITPLELGAVRHRMREASSDVASTLVRPTTPTHDPGDNDARIRITPRDDGVDMEVLLPPMLLSSYTEVVDTIPSLAEHQHATEDDASVRHGEIRHHNSSLSLLPARTIAAIVITQIVDLSMVPLRMIILGRIAQHYLSSLDTSVNSLSLQRPLLSLDDFTLPFLMAQVSRVALCSAIELMLNFTLWRLQYTAVTRIGQSWFSWGAP